MVIQAHTVKHLFGLLFLGLVFYFIERVMGRAGVRDSFGPGC